MQRDNIKVTILPILAFLLVTTSIQAQAGRGHQGPPPIPDKTQIGQMIEELDEALDLSKDQKTQISALYFAHFEEVEALQEAGKSSREVMDELRKHFQANVTVLLNKNQVKKFKLLQKNQRPPQMDGRR